MAKNELDKRRKYYLILDCETCTLPQVRELPEKWAKDMALKKPLIYDIGWTVIDRKGNIYKKKSFLITETFSVPSVFNTAYYKSKRPIYLERLKGGAIDLVTWEQAMNELVHDMENVEGVGAYNAMFDFKKAIPFTELYISKLYSENFDAWIDFQNHCMKEEINGQKFSSKKEFELGVFRFRGKCYKLFDVWNLACKYLLNTEEYKAAARENKWFTPSGKYYSTNAENAFRFCASELLFEEEHTALSDSIIESYLFAKALGNNGVKNLEWGIVYFPFKILGSI